MLTTTKQNEFCNNLVGGLLPTGPRQTRYLGLSTTKPTVGGTGFTEPTVDAGGYTRIEIGESMSAAVEGQSANTEMLNFREVEEAWLTGLFPYWGIFTDASGGTPIYVERILDPAATGTCYKIDQEEDETVASAVARAIGTATPTEGDYVKMYQADGLWDLAVYNGTAWIASTYEGLAVEVTSVAIIRIGQLRAEVK